MTTATTLAAAGIWDTLQEVTDTIVDGKLGAFQSLAVILAAMLAALSLVRTAGGYVRGEGRLCWETLRPLAILLCVMNFGLLCTAFEGVVGIFAREIAETTDSGMSDLNDAISEAFGSLKDSHSEMAEAADELAEEEGWGFWRKLREGLRIASASFFKTSQVSVLTVTAFAGRLVTELVFFVFQMLAALYMAVLRLAGPFIVALSIPEEWKGGFAGWAARYIQISLWVPTGYLVIWMLTAFFEAVCAGIVAGGLEAGIFVIGIGLVAVTVSAIMAIPKIASWFISSPGSGNAQSGLERSLQSLGRHLLK